MIVLNGKIKKANLGFSGYGVLTFQIHVKLIDGECIFGNYVLDAYDEEKKERVGTKLGTDVIIGILKTLDVNTWKELEGAYIRCEMLDNEIVRIGHIIEDNWFSILDYKN